MTTTTTTTTTLMTPAQFIVARALGRSYGHLWTTVLDEHLNIEQELDVERIAPQCAPYADQRFGGITSPALVDQDGYFSVMHRSKGGRIEWEIEPSGDTTISIYRLINGKDTKIVRLYVLNAVVKKMSSSDISEGRYNDYEMGDVMIFASSVPNAKIEFAYKYGIVHDDSVQTESLALRHIRELKHALVALLKANTPERISDYEYEKLKDKAADSLIPLINIALLDPYTAPRHHDIEGAEVPTTYFSKEYGYYEVIHEDESFPVESERVAVHASLLLQSKPDMELVDAVKEAIMSSFYRPYVS